MTPALSIVSDNDRPPPKRETPAQRVKRLHGEVKAAAHDHVRALIRSLEETMTSAAEISEGGDAYPVGARDMARRLAADCESRSLSLRAILARAK